MAVFRKRMVFIENGLNRISEMEILFRSFFQNLNLHLQKWLSSLPNTINFIQRIEQFSLSASSWQNISCLWVKENCIDITSWLISYIILLRKKSRKPILIKKKTFIYLYMCSFLYLNWLLNLKKNNICFNLLKVNKMFLLKSWRYFKVHIVAILFFQN